VHLLGSRPEGNTSSSGPRGGVPARDRPGRSDRDTIADDFVDDNIDDLPF
jgi:hypothetical protein